MKTKAKSFLKEKQCFPMYYQATFIGKIISLLIIRELLRYTRKLRCIDTSTSKIIKLTIIFME